MGRQPVPHLPDAHDPVLRARQAHEAPFRTELSDHAARAVLEGWREDVTDVKPRTELTEAFR